MKQKPQKTVTLFSKGELRETLLNIGIVRSLKYQHQGTLPSAFRKKMTDIDSGNPSDIKQLRWTLKLLGKKMLESGKPQGNSIPLGNPNLIFIPEEQRAFIGEALIKIGEGVDANIAFGFKTGHKPKADRIEENRIAMMVMWVYQIANYKPITKALRIVARHRDVHRSSSQVRAIYYKHKAQLETDLIEIGLDALKIASTKSHSHIFNGCCYSQLFTVDLWDDQNELWALLQSPPTYTRMTNTI